MPGEIITPPAVLIAAAVCVSLFVVPPVCVCVCLSLERQLSQLRACVVYRGLIGCPVGAERVEREALDSCELKTVYKKS